MRSWPDLLFSPRSVTSVVPSNLRCALSDPGGRTLVGDRPPARMVATRTAAAAGLPWTLHVSAAPDPTAAPPSPRRRLLMLTFGVVGLVLLAGWYFILRAITRELRVSRLQSDFVAAVSHEFRSPLTSMSTSPRCSLTVGSRTMRFGARRSTSWSATPIACAGWSRGCSTSAASRQARGAAARAVDVAALVRAIVVDFRSASHRKATESSCPARATRSPCAPTARRSRGPSGTCSTTPSSTRRSAARSGSRCRRRSDAASPSRCEIRASAFRPRTAARSSRFVRGGEREGAAHQRARASASRWCARSSGRTAARFG